MEKNDRIIKKAQEELEYLTGDAEVRRLAELRQKAIRDELDVKIIARNQGLKEGLEKGIYNVAKNMLRENIDIDTISKVTGLSISNIEKLK